MTRTFAVLVGLTLAAAARGQGTTPVVEGFDSVAGLSAAGWAFVNNTPSPNAAGQWRQGSSVTGLAGAAFAPQAGAAGSYVRSDYTATTDLNNPQTVSDWLILPARTMVNGGTLTFYTRANAGNLFPERLVVRMSTAGTGTNVGALPDDVGDFHPPPC